MKSIIRTLVCVHILIWLPNIVSAQTNILEETELILDSLLSGDKMVLNIDNDSLAKMNQSVKDAIVYRDLNNFSGSARFGFNGESTRDENNSLFSIYGGLKLNWDLYPGELDLDTRFGINFTDGQIEENVSRIDISYDHMHTNVGNGLMLENYVYVNRSTDGYLGIDQRYEIGGGIILNHWVRKFIKKDNMPFPIHYSNQGADQWNPFLNQYFDEIGLTAFKESYREGYNKYRKSDSKMRLALLVGAYFELEQTSVNDSIALNASNSFRWVVRPTLDVHLNQGWKMSFRPFIKMPMPWEWQSTVASENGLSDSRADYSVDFTARLTAQLLSRRISITLSYNVVYENAPPRTYYSDNEGVRLLANNDLHQSYIMTLDVNLSQK